MVGEAMKHPGNYFYVFPTKETARKALWDKIDRDGKPLLGCIPESRLYKKSDQMLLIKIHSGDNEISTIQVVGLDYNPDSIRGITPRGIVFSEFAYQDAEVYKTILPALQQYPDAWVIYNSTPNGKNHFYDLYTRTIKAPGWYSSLCQVLYPDKNGYVSNLISVDDIKMMQAESGLSDEFIEQEFGCSFEIGARGSIYSKNMEEAERTGRIGAYPYDKRKAVDTFWDLGIRDDTVIWFRQMNGQREVFFDYLKVNNMDYGEIVGLLKDKGYRYRLHFLPHDGNHTVQQTKLTDQEFIEDLLKEFNVSGDVETCPKLPKKTSINTLKSLFSNFYFNCPNWGTDKQGEDEVAVGVRDLFNYRFKYDDKRKVYTNDPYDDHTSHTCDALATRVAAMYLDNVQKYGTLMSSPRTGMYKDFDPLST